MAKKQNVKKPKAPRKRRATANKKAGAKDKSVKQNVNVNVTSSGGGGSGGASIPSAQPSYNPFINASTQGQKLGEDIQIKRLTDLLNKSILQASKPSQNIIEKATEKVVEVPNIETNIEERPQPLFEGDEFNIDYSINRKPSEQHKTLLERINTPKIQDDAEKINEPQQEEEAQQANVEYVLEGEEMSKPDNPDELFDDNIVDPDNFFSIVPKIIKNNKIPIDKVIGQTFDYYNEIGKDEPLLYDELNDYNFKIIDGVVVPWSSNNSRGPLKEYVKKYVQSHYSSYPEEISSINSNTRINYGKAPNSAQKQIKDFYYSSIEKQKKAKEELKQAKAEAKATMKVSKGKKSKNEDFIEKGDIDV